MKQTIEENPIWIPLQTTYCKELQVAEFLRDSEIPYYIPQTAVVNYCVAKRSLFSIIDSLSKAFAWFASFLSTVTTTLNQFK